MAWIKKIGVLTFLALAGLGTTAFADVVTLESFDKSISLKGELLGFDGSTYRIRSAIGEMEIDAFQVVCIGDGCPSQDIQQSEFSISGAETLIASLLPSLIEGYGIALDADVMMNTDESQAVSMSLTDGAGNDLALIKLASGGSAEGFQELINGEASLAVATRPVNATELRDMAGRGLGDLSLPEAENIIALDGLVIVTSQTNPARAISEIDMARIFSGQVRNWAEVGGPNEVIRVYVPPLDSGTSIVFHNLVMAPTGADYSRDAIVVESDAAVSDAVSNDPNAIGITSYTHRRNAKSLAVRGVCGIQTPATSFTIKTEEYPLTRRLYIYKPDQPLPPLATRFLEYLQSDAAQAVVADAGFVDQGTSTVSVNEQGLRFVASVLPSDAESTLPQLQNMMAELINGDRVSITFRFETGSARLDSRAEGDILRTADMLARGDFENKEVLLLGFTDSVGRADLNTGLSQARAEQVRQAIVAAAPFGSIDDIPIRVIGFGEMSPLGCNESPIGRQINRRVEVWTRDIVRSSF